MMIVRKSLVSLAAAGLIFGSTAAVAAPTADRAASEATASEDFAGIGTFGLLLGLLIAAGVVAVIASDDEQDAPTSP